MKRAERRRQGRFPTTGVQVQSPQLEATVLDVSTTGLRIESPQPMRRGDTYPLHLDYREQSVDLEGEVKWCRLRGVVASEAGGQAATYEAGIGFLRLVTERPAGIWRGLRPQA